MFACVFAFAAGAAEIDSVRVVAGRPSTGSVSGTVDLTVDATLAVITDCAGTAAWFPDMLGSELVEAWDHGYRCAGVTNLPWPLADRTWAIDVGWSQREDGAWIATFAYVRGSGNVAEMEGRYLLEPVGDARTRVTYEGKVDLGFWLPGCVLDWATSHLLPSVLHGLEDAGRRPLPSAPSVTLVAAAR